MPQTEVKTGLEDENKEAWLKKLWGKYYEARLKLLKKAREKDRTGISLAAKAYSYVFAIPTPVTTEEDDRTIKAYLENFDFYYLVLNKR